jgi:hypothetical protein
MSAATNPSHTTGEPAHRTTGKTRAPHVRPVDDDEVTYRSGVGLVITSCTLSDPDVEAEATRWTLGQRGEPVEAAEADGADLSEFHRTAVSLGAKVLRVAGESSTAMSLAGTVHQLAEKAELASASLIEGATKASAQAVEAAAKATHDATKATGEIIDLARRRFNSDMKARLDESLETIQQELDQLLGSENSAAVNAIKEVIGQAMSETQVAWHRSLTTTLGEVTQTLDVNNPASPLGALERRMTEHQQRQHADLAARLDQVHEAVGKTTAAATTTAAVAAAQASSPAKGKPYQEAAGAVIEAIATGMAASYSDTSDTTGSIRSCKKGDGVIEGPQSEVGGSPPRIVVEMTTQGHPRNWAQYLDVAERNRESQASIGVVPASDLVPGGAMLATLGTNRMVLAFDPETDDPGLLRAAVQLLLVQAQRRLAEDRAGDLGLVDAKLDEARVRLLEMQDILKTALAVRNGATKVVTGLEALQGSLTLTIDQARAALRGSMPSVAT